MKHITNEEYGAMASLILDTHFGDRISATLELEMDGYLFVVKFNAYAYHDMDEIPEGKFRYIRSLAVVSGEARVLRVSDLSYEEEESDFDADELAKYIIGECH